MKKILITAIAGAALLVSCGVDRDGSVDNIVDDLEQFGTVDKDCVRDVLDKYSDDQLKDFDEEAGDLGAEDTPSDGLVQYTNEVYACVTATGS